MNVPVFFYGLYMEEKLLRSKGTQPQDNCLATVSGYSLRISKRATLVPNKFGITYGVLMSFTHSEVDLLYADDSVNMYPPIPVMAQAQDGDIIPALCFILPQPPGAGEFNSEYASSLRKLAKEIGIPENYVNSIGQPI